MRARAGSLSFASGNSVPMAAGWINLTPDACYLTYSALGHIQQVWDLSRLSEEMQKLGLPWRGPVMPAATPAGSVSGPKVHNDAE